MHINNSRLISTAERLQDANYKTKGKYMSVFTKKTTSSGQVQYRKDGNLVKKDDIDEKLLARIDASKEGTEVPESADIISTPENEPDAPDEGTKTVKIHLERPIMINDKVYKGGYTEDEDGYEVPVEIEVAEDLATDLQRIDKEHSQYEKNLMRGQKSANSKTQVKVSDVA